MAGSYCKYVNELDKNSVHRMYHDTEYGFPIQDDDLLFARLVLEINQAGLSWDTILKKKENFFRAFDDFNIAKIARYTEKKKEKLMQDAGIIRNRLKIEAAIYNAKEIIALQKEFGSFKNWLDKQHKIIHQSEHDSKGEWVKLFKKHFRFTGGEIVNEFLMSTGYLPGCHSEDCDVFKKILKLKPKWAEGRRH
ncbi:MAG TPA: DNA-3-methyladenine glycosylase I [Chitinophagaceae bacterium]|nr:DNA-3-methyladenine glycosylase I [Chitinophagaceae bacterium]HND94673.1 DNA-3-methyladenine glycosylase I [Chitinophagaceae bacterium]